MDMELLDDGNTICTSIMPRTSISKLSLTYKKKKKKGNNQYR